MVEGSVLSRLMVESILSASADFSVIGAVGPDRLTQAVDDLRPDLIIIDVCMSTSEPVLAALRDYKAAKKVVIFAEGAPKHVRAKLAEAGAAACFDKRTIADDHDAFRAGLRRLWSVEPFPLPIAIDSSKEEATASRDTPAPPPLHLPHLNVQRPRALTDSGWEDHGWTMPAITGEPARLEALAALDIANASPDKRLDLITHHLCKVTDYPMAAITLIDESMQWTKAAAGMETKRIPRSEAICAHTIACAAPLVVSDTREHPVFSTFPSVTGYPGIRAYLGIPLMIGGDLPIGAICLLDTRPRASVQREISLLLDMARLVVAMLDGPAPRLAA